MADQRVEPSLEPEAQAPDDLVWVCRSARLTRPAYRFYRAILLIFAERGRAPSPAEVAELAACHGVALHATLAQFAAQDLVQREPTTGAIRAAYPFSGQPTAHRVRLAETAEQPAVEVYAMCAIDALGVPLMLRRAAVITSADGLTGEPVRVRVTATPTAMQAPDADADAPGALAGGGWRVEWEPLEAVVYARLEDHEHEHDSGCEAAGACCPVTNFFTSEAHAQEWATSAPIPHADGRIYTRQDALRYAARLFGGVLDRLPLDALPTDSGAR